MTVTIPDYVEAEGNVKVAWIPAVAAPAAATVAELNAGVDLECYLPETWGGITGEQSKGEQRRMCTKEAFEAFGRVKRSISPLTATYMPQDAAGAAGNEAKTAMAEGTEGYIVVRYGLPSATAWAASQVYDIIPAKAGVQNKNTNAQDEFAPLTYTQEVIATGPLVEDGVVAV